MIVVIALIALFVSSYKPSKSTRFAALRIGWSFIQVTALYAQFDLNWPKEIRDVYKWLSFVILDIQITSPECSIGEQLDYYLLLQAKMLMPMAFVATLVIIYFGGLIVMKYKFLNNKENLTSALFRSILVLLVMFYIPLCQFTLQYFNCTHQPDGSWSLDAQPSYNCYDSKHLSYKYWALWGVFAYMIGIPSTVATILRKNKDHLYENKYYSRFGFLASRFKPDYYYWEVVILIRLCLLTIVLMMLDSSVPMQTMTGITVLFIAAIMQDLNKPFISSRLNYLESYSLLASANSIDIVNWTSILCC
jgi:hypothetical protein